VIKVTKKQLAKTKTSQSLLIFRKRWFLFAAVFKLWPAFFSLLWSAIFMAFFLPADIDPLKILSMVVAFVSALCITALKTATHYSRYKHKDELFQMRRQIR